MIVYMKVIPETGFRIAWTELKPGARSINQRNMPMLRSEWWLFRRMMRDNLQQEKVGNAIYLTERILASRRNAGSAIRNLLSPPQR